MASPTTDFYGVASGQPVAGGRYRSPDWVRSAAVNEWTLIPNSTLSSSGAGWAGTHPGGWGNYTDLLTAWSGGVLNTSGVWIAGSFVPGTFLVLFGGGHGNYGGNELYAFGPLESNNPYWSRITDPSIPAPYNVGRLDGYPVSRHTYDSLVYLPTVNKMLCIGAAGYYSIGFNFNQADIFDFSINPFSANPWTTADVGFPEFTGVGTINLMSGYDKNNDKAWGVSLGNGAKICSYNVSDGVWSYSTINNPDMIGNSKCGLDSDRSLIVSLTEYGGVRAVDFRSSPTIFAPDVSGAGPGYGRLSIEWDSVRNCFCCWAKTGKTMYFLTPGANPYSGGDPWVWSSNSPASGATPSDPLADGHVFGRFRVANIGSSRGYVLMPTYNAPIAFYRTV